jgi:hypothetical protein
MKLVDEMYEDVEASLSAYGNTRVRPVFVKLQNVADYYYNGTPQDDWNLTKDFPNIAPSWPLFIATWRTPTTYNSNGSVLPYGNPGAETAVTVVAMEVTAELRPLRWVLILNIQAQQAKLAGGARLLGLTWVPVDADGHFYDPSVGSPQERALSTFLSHGTAAIGHGLKTPVRNNQLWVRPTPTFACVISNGRIILGRSDAQNSELVNDVWSAVRPVLLGLCFTHCGNITTTTELVPDALRKRRAERGRAPVDRWYTLEIGPIKETLKNARNADGSPVRSLQQALTICRGHFKTFSEHGLFGRYKGTFWWGMHVRGNAASGVIHKNYSIRTEE